MTTNYPMEIDPVTGNLPAIMVDSVDEALRVKSDGRVAFVRTAGDWDYGMVMFRSGVGAVYYGVSLDGDAMWTSDSDTLTEEKALEIIRRGTDVPTRDQWLAAFDAAGGMRRMGLGVGIWRTNAG